MLRPKDKNALPLFQLRLLVFIKYSHPVSSSRKSAFIFGEMKEIDFKVENRDECDFRNYFSELFFNQNINSRVYFQSSLSKS